MTTEVTASQSVDGPGPLEGLRAVEVGDFGEVTGKLLADAGVEVVRVEPREGARSRHTGPFVADEPGIDRSLSFAARNTSKRSVTLELTTVAGAELFARLARQADIVIDSSGGDVLDGLGVGYGAFDDAAGLVWCSLTPFGLTGPWRDWPWVDLVSLALGGPMMSTGYDDHELPPIRPDGEHSVAISNEYAVTGILAALLLRDGDGPGAGRGQHLDVSAHEAISATTEGAFPNWEYLRRISGRQTGRHASPAPHPPWQHQCADGEYILLMGGGVPRDQRILAHLLEWMDEYEAAEDLHDPEYVEVLYRDPTLRPDARRHVAEVIGRFVRMLPAEEVYRRGQSMHLPWGRVRRPEQNLDDPHWTERGFWWEGEVPGHSEPVRYPGAPYRFTKSPVRMRRRPPLLGEHNHEVFAGELGLTTEQLTALARDGAI